MSNFEKCENCYVAEFKVQIGDVVTSIHWEDLKVYIRAIGEGTQDECKARFDKDAELLSKSIQNRDHPGEAVKVRWEFEGLGQGHYHTRLASGEVY